jgi:CheY-like chemotaxis protein
MPRILLVEDNELNRDMLSRRLIRRGYRVDLAADGREGLQMADTSAPDLILLDLSLPEMDGWEVLQLLKRNPKMSRIPVMALTAHALVTDRTRALEAGFDDYDIKPVEMPRLLTKIETLLNPEAEA